MSQLRGIDLVVNKFLREDHPDNEMVEVDIKAEKFIVSYMCVLVSIIDTTVKRSTLAL